MDSSQEVSDVYSLSDHLLAERLQFVKEIGFGNWGSVWLCRPKSSSGKVKDMEVAVKLVHRSKTSTTAARVRSLWNEMKIVRSFKHDPHPSIVPFHSFIITPSYALITMAYLPTLVPVEVSEPRAKDWFKSLLSGVHFLHSRGVVHNDIKPANILLSPSSVPVLVDFGFAEKYDLASSKAFHSNLTYGTPEYLSPERARGLPHDTRKSDIWSLGVTFFEILVGRTPFEYEEGEVFEKKEDLERYWNRTMRGKWVGKYTMSQPAERFLKRMIVPNADLRCTAAEAMEDAYWETIPASVTPSHRKTASAAVPSSGHARTSSLLDSFKDSFKDKDKNKEQSFSRLLDVALPWSASRSASRSSASRSASRIESASRPASRLDSTPRSTLRTEHSLKTTATSSTSRSQTPNTSPQSIAKSANHATKTGAPSPVMSPSLRVQTHSRSMSQPKLRTPPGVSPGSSRTRKLSTVQASPIVKPLEQFNTDTENRPESVNVRDRHGHNKDVHPAQTVISLNSVHSAKRPLSSALSTPHSTPSAASKAPSTPLSRRTSLEKKRLSHLRTPTCEKEYAWARAHAHPTTTRNVLQTPPSSFNLVRASPQTSAPKRSGKPPRTRGGAGVLADLTGFARNVDLGAHGVAPTPKRTGDKKTAEKENSRGRITTQKENKENGDVQTSRRASRIPHGTCEPTPLSPKTKHQIQTQDRSNTSFSLSANISGATTVTKGSVRDRMMDWERERARLREMDRLADASTDGHGSTVLTDTNAESDSDSDSEVEAEVVAEAARKNIPVEIEVPKEVKTHVGLERPTTAQTATTSSASTNTHSDKGQIEVAKIGVRASAQLIPSRNASASLLALNQSLERKPSEEGQVRDESVTDIGLPVEMRRSGELGLSSLRQSVKASIDKGMRLYKSSTLGQLTGRNTPAWCASPEPIDFEQRRSGEEGRFSWEDIRPEHEIALDRMNMWIQSVEKVVEETRQNFASTTVTPPAPLPLAPISRSSSQYPALQNNSLSRGNNKNDTFNTSRSSRLPRRALAANEIFAEPTDPDALLSPGTSCREDQSTSFSYIDAAESSLPVLPPISVLMQTPRRPRRATISTGSPVQPKLGSTASGIFEGSPSKRREKSKSQSNLDRHIQDVAKLEMELNRAPVTTPTPLSAVLDRSLFVAPPVSPRFTEEFSSAPGPIRSRSILFDDLNSSPYLVEPYPPRQSGEQAALASPHKRQLEGVYDRFLMSTSGIKRVGKGYQSENMKPGPNTVSSTEHAKARHSRGFVFGSAKRPMAPPVSSEDIWRRSTSIDELGFVVSGQGASSSRVSKDAGKSTFVRRAIKAMVPGKTVSRRLSRTIVV